MDVTTMIVIAVAVVVLVGLGLYAWQRRQSQAFAERYGPEYERVVTEAGSQRRAQAELKRRAERVEQLDIQPLTAQQHADYLRQWRGTQARFVDDPDGAITVADVLVEDVMKTRGYPVTDFDQRAADLSVHHSRVVDNYRAARDIARRHRQGDATTEDLRRAMIYYRDLFEDLLEDREHGAVAERPVERPVERAADIDPAANGAEPRVSRDDREVRP